MPTGWTGFFRVQSLVHLILQHQRARTDADQLLDSLSPATPAARQGDSAVRG
jgi:hypothetical protein